MDDRPGVLLVCNCAGTMDIDGAALGKALGGSSDLTVHTQLCRRQIASFEAALDGGASVIVACTQEAPLFAEVAEERGKAVPQFVNVRERAGWCEAGDTSVLPKMAALIAEARYISEPTGLMAIESRGQCLVYGRGQAAMDVAQQLSARLSVTLLLLSADEAMPPSTAKVPIHTGKIRGARGRLGQFELMIDAYGQVEPSSREALSFENLRNGASTTCDLILDITGNPPLFLDGEGRDGYFRADPGNPAALASAMFRISDMVGEFEKPLYVSYNGDICAHGRSGKIGCRNCIDACPKSAVVSAGDVVEIDPGVCGGCGGCSASCPTGAVSYAYPKQGDLLQRLQILVATYRGAGGKAPELLLHDGEHGAELIAAMARYGKGLPANVLPVSLHSVLEVGHDLLAAAFAFGFRRVAILLPPNKAAERDVLDGQIALAQAFLDGLGYAGERIALIDERDPGLVEEALRLPAELDEISGRAFAATGGKREVARLALMALNEMAPSPQEAIALPAGAPYGRLDIDVAGCTLCLACVGACPAGALNDDPDRPRLAFTEAACVQCGLCVATCPERVIKLEPRYDFTSAGQTPATVKEEEPYQCIRCGKEFGTKSTVERIVAKLEGHSMFQNAEQIEMIKMCDDCRVITLSEREDNPFRMGERPRVRTTDDYLMDREADEEA